MASATEEFRRELATMRDGLVQAIDRSAPGEIAAGLEVYSDLVRGVLRSYRPLEEQLGVAPRTWRSGYGRVVEWLQEDLRLFARRTLEAGDVENVRVLLEVLDGLLSDCVAEDEVDAHRTVLSVFEYIWRLGPELLARGWEELRWSELAWLTSHLDYRLGPAAQASLEGAKSDLVRQVLSTLVALARKAIDADRRADLDDAIASLSEVFPRLTLKLDQVKPREDGARYLLQLRDAYALALEAYVVMRYRFKRSDAGKTKSDYQSVARVPRSVEPWIALWHLQRQEGIGGIDLSSWELDLFEGRIKGGFLGFEEDVRLAFVLRLLDGRVDDRPPLDQLVELSQVHTVRYFLERIVQAMESDRRVQLHDVLSSESGQAQQAKAEIEQGRESQGRRGPPDGEPSGQQRTSRILPESHRRGVAQAHATAPARSRRVH
jgi:hypothetical protein